MSLPVHLLRILSSFVSPLTSSPSDDPFTSLKSLLQLPSGNQSTSSLPSPLSLASSLFGVLFTNSIMFISHSTTNVHKLLRSKSIFIDFIAKGKPSERFHVLTMSF